MSAPGPFIDQRTDGELIHAASIDPAAFEALFTRHAVPLRAWLFAQTGNVGVANELLAETFAQAWRGRKRFRGDHPDSGVAWLYGIGRNLARRHHRCGRVEVAGRKKLGVGTDLHHEDHAEDVIERLDATALSPAITAAFDELTQDQKTAIGWRVIDELSYEEVAERLGCTPQTARARVSRGLRSMRSTIEETT